MVTLIKFNPRRFGATRLRILIFNQVFEGPTPLGFSFYTVGDASCIFRLNAHMRAPFFQIVPWRSVQTQILPVWPALQLWCDTFC